MPSASIINLQNEWNVLYRTTLPNLAREKSLMQPRWPVVLGHCFARIILDNAVGIDRPWTEVLKAPAYKHMNEKQLHDAIILGQSLITGETSLVDLDEQSLRLRGKKSKTLVRMTKKQKQITEPDSTTVTRSHTQIKIHKEGPPENFIEETRAGATTTVIRSEDSPANVSDQERKDTAKRKRHESTDDTAKRAKTTDGDVSKYFTPTTPKPATNPSATTPVPDIIPTHSPHTIPLLLLEVRDIINNDTSLTPFRKHVLTLLTQVPPGRYTTYAAIANHISSLSQSPLTGSTTGTVIQEKKEKKSCCARAVGNAMRNNPFAPAVPCHRVLASDGRIGGFGGEWGEQGKYAAEKKSLLRDEGVKFDGKGKVVGRPFVDFVS